MSPEYSAVCSGLLQLCCKGFPGCCTGTLLFLLVFLSVICTSGTQALKTFTFTVLTIQGLLEKKNFFVKMIATKNTYRKQESSRSSADRTLRPMGTQSLSASWEKQVETESTQNSTRVERNVLPVLLLTVRSSIFIADALTFLFTRTSESMQPRCKDTSRWHNRSNLHISGRSSPEKHLER